MIESADRNARVEILFSLVDIETSWGCEADYLQLREGVIIIILHNQQSLTSQYDVNIHLLTSIEDIHCDITMELVTLQYPS